MGGVKWGAEVPWQTLNPLKPRSFCELGRRGIGPPWSSSRRGFTPNFAASRATLQTTALVHEAYLRLIDVNNADWEHRVHFFAVSAQIMRRILVDGARGRATAKRGGGMPRVNLDEIADVSSGRGNELIALDEALENLAKLDPRKARVIELRFFGGLSVEETAAVLKVSPDTVMRDWRLARSWLLLELSGQT
jgi:RNA polymerase sigma-70 factor (ECF subfamily)